MVPSFPSRGAVAARKYRASSAGRRSPALASGALWLTTAPVACIACGCGGGFETFARCPVTTAMTDPQLSSDSAIDPPAGPQPPVPQQDGATSPLAHAGVGYQPCAARWAPRPRPEPAPARPWD